MNTATVIRPAPATARNGLPGWKPYVYRGTGHDTLTAFMDEFEPEFDTPGDKSQCYCGGEMRDYRKHLELGEDPCQDSRDAVNFYHRTLAARKRLERCATCGYKRGGPNCKTLCGAA